MSRVLGGAGKKASGELESCPSFPHIPLPVGVKNTGLDSALEVTTVFLPDLPCWCRDGAD